MYRILMRNFKTMRQILFLILSIGFLNCSKTDNDESSNNIELDKFKSMTLDKDSLKMNFDTTDFENNSYLNIENYIIKEKIDSSKFDVIDFDCAIIVYPTIEQIDEMKKEYGEEDFYIVADDNNWYQSQAISIIDSIGVKVITINKRFVRLKGVQTTWDLDVRKKNLPAWNLIFFKTDKKPKIAAPINLTVDEVRDYYR